MPAFENQRQQDEEQEFKVILGYAVNWRLTWATWELVNQKRLSLGPLRRKKRKQRLCYDAGSFPCTLTHSANIHGGRTSEALKK